MQTFFNSCSEFHMQKTDSGVPILGTIEFGCHNMLILKSAQYPYIIEKFNKIKTKIYKTFGTN